MEASAPGPQPVGEGWALFAGVLFLIFGVFNVIHGIVAIAEDQNLVAENLFFGSLKMWGWIALILGAVQVLTALLIFARSAAGQMLGIFLAFLAIFAHLLWIAVFPLWSVTAIIIAGLVIYGLTVYGDQFE